MRDKSVTIPETLFVELSQYFLLDKKDSDTERRIKKGLSDKLDRIVNHNLYTASKTASTAEEREQARQEYLDRVGVPESFRWN